MKKTRTLRGFTCLEFKDAYGESCSLQASSRIGNYEGAFNRPGTSAVWLGLDQAKPMVMACDARAVGVATEETTGWVDYPIPSQVMINTRMHLDREQVRGLIAALQEWLDVAEDNNIKTSA